MNISKKNIDKKNSQSHFSQRKDYEGTNLKMGIYILKISYIPNSKARTATKKCKKKIYQCTTF